MRQLFILFIISFSFIQGKSQQRLMQFSQLTTDNGLSSSQVVSLFQDYKGFMWIGTYSGLNKYDGKDFVVYKHNEEDFSSIADNVAKAICEDSKNRLFVGTFQGLSMYDRNLDCFINFQNDTNSALFNFGMSVFSIASDSIGNLWLGAQNGLFRFHLDNNTVTHYEHNPNNSNSLSNNFIEHVYLDSKNKLWISTHSGLNLFNTITGQFEPIPPILKHTNSKNSMYHTSVIEDKTGNIWIGTHHGLFCIESSSNNMLHFYNNPLDDKSLSHNYIVTLYVDHENNLWVGTENGGINLFNRNKQNFSHYRIDATNSKSLNNESIWALTHDRNKNFWVGTFGGGINISVNGSDFIVNYSAHPGNPNSLSHNIVKDFIEDENGMIWIATDGGGLNQFDINTGKFTSTNISNSAISSNAILCLEQGNPNQIWLGTWAGGLVNYNKKTKEIKTYTTKNSSIADDNIHSIAKDSKGNLWLGSQNGGLIHFDVKHNTFKSYLPENSGINNKRISLVRIDKNDILYLGATTSMQIFNPSHSQFTTYEYNENDSNSISNNYIIDILIQNDTSIWIGAAHGLNRFNPVTKKFTKYFVSDGLPNNLINAIALDKSEKLWLTTGNGLCWFDYKGKTLSNFYKSDGLQGNEFIDRSILSLKNGKILVGGINGFNIISPDLVSQNSQIPDVVITGFSIFNRPASIGGKDDVLKKQISESNEITLKHAQSVITFKFAVLDFTNTLKNNYAYMMEGFDKDWVYCQNRNEVTYTNLNPGKYVFRVKGSNNQGVWNEVGTSLKITIMPPWWRTKLAIFLYVILVISVFFAFYWYRINQLKRQKVILESLVKERTQELNLSNQQLLEHQIQIENQSEELQVQAENMREANNLLLNKQQFILKQTQLLKETNNELVLSNATKDKFFSIIAHDLKNPFNTIMGFSDLLTQQYTILSDDERKELIGLVNESSNKLFRLLENLLEWGRSQTGSIKFQPEEFVINDLIDCNIALVENMALKKKISIIQKLESEIKIVADRNMINTVLRNLITNAIKFTENGSIEISVVQLPESTTVSIKDSGVGINNEKLKNIFGVEGSKSTAGTHGETGTGLGLILCKEFIEKHGGTIGVNSEPNQGSTFYFTLPANVNIT